jgi:hypothetical protein
VFPERAKDKANLHAFKRLHKKYSRGTAEWEGKRRPYSRDPVDFRSWSPQLFNHKVKLPTAPEEMIFSYDETGRAYCPLCWEKRQSPPGVLEESSYDQFWGAVQQIASAWPGGCEIHVDPPEYTREDRVKEIEQQERECVRYPHMGVVS